MEKEALILFPSLLPQKKGFGWFLLYLCWTIVWFQYEIVCYEKYLYTLTEVN